MNYKLEPEYETNFSIFNEPSVENIFTIPMNKTLYTNQMQYLFRSRHYNHAKAYGLSGENGPVQRLKHSKLSVMGQLPKTLASTSVILQEKCMT